MVLKLIDKTLFLFLGVRHIIITFVTIYLEDVAHYTSNVWIETEHLICLGKEHQNAYFI